MAAIDKNKFGSYVSTMYLYIVDRKQINVCKMSKISITLTNGETLVVKTAKNENGENIFKGFYSGDENDFNGFYTLLFTDKGILAGETTLEETTANILASFY